MTGHNRIPTKGGGVVLPFVVLSLIAISAACLAYLLGAQ